MPWPLTDGGAIGIFNITKSLAELGHDITLVTFPHENPRATAEATQNLDLYAKVVLAPNPLPSRARVLVRTLFRGAYPIERRMMAGLFDAISNLLSKEDFDVVHIDHAHMGKYGIWIQNKFQLPVLLREHNFESLIYERFANVDSNPLKRLIARVHGQRLRYQELDFIRRFDGIAAITETDATLMRNAVPSANIRVIPAGVDTDYFQPSGNNREDSTRILWIGSLEWDPNVDAVRYFLDAIFPTILASQPNAVFEIVGSHSEKTVAAASKFGDRVLIHGRVPDVRDYLDRAAVLVVPLRIGGGMRLKLLDFFASGKAVVSTAIGAEGNLAENEKHLLIRDDPQAFAQGVVELCISRDRRDDLGQNARQLVVENYSWESIGKEFSSFYQSIISNKIEHPIVTNA